jgi:hypothetical protein
VLHQSQHTAVNLRIRITAADDRITSGSDPRERSPSCHACYRSNTKDLTRSLISICVPERLWRRESITCEARLFSEKRKDGSTLFPLAPCKLFYELSGLRLLLLFHPDHSSIGDPFRPLRSPAKTIPSHLAHEP